MYCNLNTHSYWLIEWLIAHLLDLLSRQNRLDFDPERIAHSNLNFFDAIRFVDKYVPDLLPCLDQFSEAKPLPTSHLDFFWIHELDGVMKHNFSEALLFNVHKSLHDHKRINARRLQNDRYYDPARR